MWTCRSARAASASAARSDHCSLNIAIAVPPWVTLTLFEVVGPDDGLQVTEYVPGESVSLRVDEVPFEAPFTENAQVPPTATATSVPVDPVGAGGGAGTRLSASLVPIVATVGATAVSVATEVGGGVALASVVAAVADVALSVAVVAPGEAASSCVATEGVGLDPHADVIAASMTTSRGGSARIHPG